MKKFLVTLIVGILFAWSVQAQVFNAKINRPTVPEGETFLLTLSYEGASINDSPELGVLDNDFLIYSVANSYGMQIVNGKMNQSRQWNLILMPKRSGDLIIPSIKLGNEQSQPLNIKILDAASSAAAMQTSQAADNVQAAETPTPQFSLKGRINNNNPYVQQEIIYKLSLFDSGGLQGSEPAFDLKDGKEWSVRALGEPEIRPLTVNGQSRREIIFSYALFPQKSGKLTIPRVVFNGYYLSKSSKRYDPFQDLFGEDLTNSGFGMSELFATRNPITLATKPIEVEVKSIPEDNNGRWWLPAKNVMLVGEWEPKKPDFRVGDAVNRILYIKANGVIDSQLPELKFKPISGLKQYPEKPQTQMTVTDGAVQSVAKITNVYIPNRSGEIIIPPVSVDWFNVETGKYEQALLPEAKINVAPSLNMAEEEKPVPEITPIEERGQTLEAVAKETVNFVESEFMGFKLTQAYLIASVLAAFVLGIFLTYLLLRPKNRASCQLSSKDYQKEVVAKAKARDLRGLRDAILEWTTSQYKASRVSSFNDVKILTKDTSFGDELDKITAELYSENSQSWDGSAFLKAFDKVNHKKIDPQAEAKLLPDLYK